MLVGDSIAHEARIPLAEFLSERSIGLDTVTFPGLAPCDLFEAAATTAAETQPDLAILLFTGNAISPCMREANDPTSDAYFATYRNDMTAIVDVLTGANAGNETEVWVVEPLPYAKPSTVETVARLDEIFQSIDGVAGAIPIRDLFTTANDTYSVSLPCILPDEPCPTVQVRAEDGVHLGNDGTDNQFGRNRLAFAIDRFLDRNYE